MSNELPSYELAKFIETSGLRAIMDGVAQERIAAAKAAAFDEGYRKGCEEGFRSAAEHHVKLDQAKVDRVKDALRTIIAGITSKDNKCWPCTNDDGSPSKKKWTLKQRDETMLEFAKSALTYLDHELRMKVTKE